MRLAALALLAGLVTSIAIALYIASYGSIHSLRGMYTEPAIGNGLPSWVRDDWPAPTQIRSMPSRKPGYICVGLDCLAEGSVDEYPPCFVTFWSSRFGWPLPALEWLEVGAFQDADKRSARVRAAMAVFEERVGWRAGAAYPAWTGVGGAMDRRVIPTHPLWLGLAVDTLVYGLPSWVLIAAPGIVRRAGRRRKGLCLRCGYPLGAAAVCSECGQAARTGKRVS